MFLFNKKKNKNNSPEKCYTKLEFGCGGKRLKPGFVGVDVRKCKHVKFVCNSWEIINFVPEGTVTEIYSRHFFEHLTFIQADKTLRAWSQILTSGGTVQIILPDMQYHIEQFLSPDRLMTSEVNPKWTVLEHALAGFWGWQREGQTKIWDIHKSGYDFECLKMKLAKHGFCDIRRITDKAWNLNVICNKPE